MRKSLFSTGLGWLWVALLVILMDQYSKIWVMSHLNLSDTVRILPVFDLDLAYNTGAAFCFLHNASGWQNIALGSLAVVVSVVIIAWLRKQTIRASWMCIAMSLVLGGALGNAWDRLQYGFVVDFLSFHLGDWHFAIFNVADSAICVGAFMLLWHWVRQSSKKE